MILHSQRPLRLVILIVLAGILGVVALKLPHRRQDPEVGWYDRGAQAAARGEFAVAGQYFQRATTLNPKFAPAYDALAACYLASGNIGGSLEAIDRFHTLSGDHAYAAIRVAETYSHADNGLLLRWSREAALQQPRSPRAHALLALGLARAGFGRDSLAHIAMAEQSSPSPILEKVMKEGVPLVDRPDRLAPLLEPVPSLLSY